MFNNKSVVLNTVLRPETVVALEGISFALRAEALPGVIEASESIEDVLLSGDNTDEDMIDVRHVMRIAPDSEERQITTERFVIAGGLCYDHDSEHLNPCEPGTANGSIYHASTRRGDAEEQSKFYAALGLNSDGNKDFSCQPVASRIVKRVMKGIGDDLSLLTRLLHRLRATHRPVSKASLESVIQFAMDQEGLDYVLDYIADYLFGVPYWRMMDSVLQDKLQPLVDLFSESEAEKAWDEASAAGELGEPLAVSLDIYEHSGIAYSVSGTGMNCRWDTSRAAAVWVPDKDAIDNIRSSVLSELGIGRVAWFGALGSQTDPLNARFSLDGITWEGEGKGWNWSQALEQMISSSPVKIERAKLDALLYAKAREYCKGILEEFNYWRNGEAYGVVTYVIDRSTGERIEAHDEECWGYLGSSYAEEELEAQMLTIALTLVRPSH